MRSDGPLIVQSDKTLLLEVATMRAGSDKKASRLVAAIALQALAFAMLAVAVALAL